MRQLPAKAVGFRVLWADLGDEGLASAGPRWFSVLAQCQKVVAAFDKIVLFERLGVATSSSPGVIPPPRSSVFVPVPAALLRK